MSGGARGKQDAPGTDEERAERPKSEGPKSEGPKKRRRLELSGTQVVGAMLATMTGTLFASKLGVLGTVAGAALMSVASTVGTAVYQYYLRRGGERLRDARHLTETSALRQATRAHRPGAAEPHANAALGGARSPGAEAGRGEPVQATLPFPDAVPAVTAHAAVGTGAHHPDGEKNADGKDTGENGADANGAGTNDDGTEEGAEGKGRRRSWKLYAAMAVGVFVLVMGGVTVYEAIVGKPLSSVVNGDDGSGTTLGDLGGGSGSTAPPGEGGTTTSVPEPDSTGKGDDGDTGTTPRPDESRPSDDSTTGGDSEGGSGGDSTDPTPEPTTGEQQTPAPGDDGALGDGSGDGQDLEAPDVITTPAPSAALDAPTG